MPESHCGRVRGYATQCESANRADGLPAAAVSRVDWLSSQLPQLVCCLGYRRSASWATAGS